MTDKINVKVYDYGSDLYPEYPSRFEAITEHPRPEFSSLPLTACGATVDEAVSQVVEYYKDELQRGEEFKRERTVRDAPVLVETQVFEL